MQIIEFLSAKQQRNVFDDIDYQYNMSKYELSIIKWFWRKQFSP